MSTESDFLAWVRTQQVPSQFVALGAGDDLAVLNPPLGDAILVGIDQVLDGVHFDSSVHSPFEIGKKAMNRNLSDCAAMACLPMSAVVSVALPRGVGLDYAKELYRGLREAGDAFDCAIVGGDTGSWPGKLAVTVSITGRNAGRAPITRQGAKAGDGIYVSGALGGSIRGRHMTFEPQVNLGFDLARRWKVTSMIDLSDGLSRDLPRLSNADGSPISACVFADKIPIHEDAIEMRRDGHSPLEHALHDGEDYELLFTAEPMDFQGLPVTRIGVVLESGGVVLDKKGVREPLIPLAWEHTL